MNRRLLDECLQSTLIKSKHNINIKNHYEHAVQITAQPLLEWLFHHHSKVTAHTCAQLALSPVPVRERGQQKHYSREQLPCTGMQNLLMGTEPFALQW